MRTYSVTRTVDLLSPWEHAILERHFLKVAWVYIQRVVELDCV